MNWIYGNDSDPKWRVVNIPPAPHRRESLGAEFDCGCAWNFERYATYGHAALRPQSSGKGDENLLFPWITSVHAVMPRNCTDACTSCPNKRLCAFLPVFESHLQLTAGGVPCPRLCHAFCFTGVGVCRPGLIKAASVSGERPNPPNRWHVESRVAARPKAFRLSLDGV